MTVPFISALFIPVFVFPFSRRWRWHLKNRQHHLIEVTHDFLDDYPSPYKEVLQARTRSMARWLKIRAVLFALVYFGIIASVAGILLDRLPRFDLVEDLFDTINTIAQSLTTVFVVVLALVMRYLGQLEADLIGCLAVGDRKDGPKKRK